MRIYDRKTKQYEEIVQYGQGALKFLYGNFFGRIVLKIVVSPAASHLYGYINSRPASRKKIPGFIDKVLSLYSDFQDDKITIDEIKKELWEVGGVRLQKGD